ncbi:mannose-6-phosphate isomerase, class I [Pseudarthrobacter sp. NPDC055928]|uniref:mannose-6-phosphate isomerase, class I n=1 Tax=Pseudarthrobacter sp. NPDC055928 TaxID=3345661 RepID=UPI0035D82D1D
MYTLENTVREYAWGSKTLLSGYLDRAPSGAPEAELWLGAHPGAPSMAKSHNGHAKLNDLIETDPEGLLGGPSRAAFGDTLPFLMKVLAADSPLSLQVHPTREQAAAGFAAEEASGVPLESEKRNYKDPNHKPEMILALTEFGALCGLRPASESAAIFELLVTAFRDTGVEVPPVLERTVAALSGPDGPASLRAAFVELIHGGTEVCSAVEAVAGLLRSGLPEGPFTEALETALQLSGTCPSDPGVLISLMLNRVSLRPGEAVYLPAGNIHAYLHGLGIEVMASSDNVLRGGLTAKHIDVDELLRTVDFTPLPVPRLSATSAGDGRKVWNPPFEEFQLQEIQQPPGNGGIELPSGSPAVILAVAGAVTVTARHESLQLGRGDSAFIRADDGPVTLRAAGPDPLVAFVVTTAAAPIDGTSMAFSSEEPGLP